MKEKDLRIGNKVLDSYGFELKVVGVYEGEIYLNFDGNEGDFLYYRPEELKGVPLTNDSLERLGFTNPRDVDTEWCFNSLYVTLETAHENGFSVVLNDNYTEFWLNDVIEYIHDIQNLIYSLYKIEL